MKSDESVDVEASSTSEANTIGEQNYFSGATATIDSDASEDAKERPASSKRLAIVDPSNGREIEAKVPTNSDLSDMKEELESFEVAPPLTLPPIVLGIPSQLRMEVPFGSINREFSIAPGWMPLPVGALEMPVSVARVGCFETGPLQMATGVLAGFGGR